MNNTLTFAEGFGAHAGIDDSIEVELADGNIAKATIVLDDSGLVPWKEHDGHGIVTEWRRKDYKSPGERTLCEDHGSALFYDVQASTKKARADGWGCAKTGHEHKTKGEEVACAVEQDYQYLRGWCQDDWSWVGVVLSIETEDEDGNREPIEKGAESLWGIESNSNDDGIDYFQSVANDLLAEYLHRSA